jgi:hypothetical protein
MEKLLRGEGNIRTGDIQLPITLTSQDRRRATDPARVSIITPATPRWAPAICSAGDRATADWRR